jgi:hypothetical protein
MHTALDFISCTKKKKKERKKRKKKERKKKENRSIGLEAWLKWCRVLSKT